MTEAVYERLDMSAARPESKTSRCCALICGPPDSRRRSTWKSVGKGTGAFCAAYCCCYILLLQSIMYLYACMYCSAGKLANFKYMAPEPDIIPMNTLIIEQDPAKFTGVRAFQVCQGNEERDSCVGASFGVYYRYWGPVFWTYVFEDNNARELFIIRDRPIAVGGSHKIMRCDGKGEPFVYSVGGHWLSNKFRYLFGMQTSSEYNIWEGNNKVGLTYRVGSLSTNPQLLFKKPGEEDAFSSARMNTRHYEHKWDEWQVVASKHMQATVPAYVVNGITALFAFHEAADVPKKHVRVVQDDLFLAAEGAGDLASAAEWASASTRAENSTRVSATATAGLTFT